MARSDALWDEIKNLPIEMFSLSNQRVSMHVERLAGTKDELYLKLKSPATLPSLEAVLRSQKTVCKEKRYDRPHAEPEVVDVVYPKYTMTEDGGYIIVSYYLQPEERQELQKSGGDFFVSGKADLKSESAREAAASTDDVESEVKDAASNDVKASKPKKPRTRKTRVSRKES